MEQLLQLNEFFVEGGDQEKSHVLLHITEPSTPEEKKKGYFFAICEINHGDTDTIAKIQEIIDEIENSYYELSETSEHPALETVLEKVNQENLMLANSGHSINCVVGAIRHSEIIFSYFGSPQILLFYKNRQDLFQTMDLRGSEKSEPSTQLFSQIVQGKVSPGDYLFVGTPQVAEIFNADRLQKIVTNRPSKQSADHLERVLGELRGGFSFGGIIIHVNVNSETILPKKRPATGRGSRESLSNLFSTEQNTARTLSPTMFGRAGERVKSMLGGDENGDLTAKPTVSAMADNFGPAEINSAHVYPHRPARLAPKKKSTQEGLRDVLTITALGLKYFGRGLIWILLLIWSLVYGLIRAILLLIFIAINYKGRRRAIIEDFKRRGRLWREGFSRLPLITKIMLIASLVVVLIFASSIFYLRASERRAYEQSVYQSTLESIKNKTDAAESAVLYKDDAAALQNINDTKQLLEKLNCQTKDQKAACQNISDDLAAILAKVRRLITVRPTLLASFPDASIKNLVKINNRLIGISPATGTLFSYDLLTKESRLLPFADNIIGFIGAAVPKENDYAVFVYNRHSLMRYNPVDSSFKLIDVSFPFDNTDLAGVTIYNRRLYALDKAHNQIYKHDAIKTGFGPGKDWLKDSSATLQNSSDLTIDGDIYVYNNSGQILKFTAGQGVAFNIQGLDPALTGGGKIWTYNGLNYIYVLESAGKRLIMLTSDGRLKAQITAAEFVNPTGLAVDEASRAAYVSDGGNIYKITLPN